MCTLSWLREPTGYQVFFNRDERLTRLTATAPAVGNSGPRRFIAPADGDFGGTWIAVNDRGLCLCLLNGFAPGGGPTGVADAVFTSRGILPLELIAYGSTGEAAARILERDLGRFRPFVLVGLDPIGPGITAHWSGVDLDVGAAPSDSRPLVSSSFFTEEVRRSRCAVFEATVCKVAEPHRVGAHVAFHRSHDPARGPHSPCMHRDDGRTVSFTRVRVTGELVEMRYAPDSPCTAETGDPVRLPRI